MGHTKGVVLPYIAQPARKAIQAGNIPLNAGQLNYKLTVNILEYLDAHGLSYQTINDIVGALTGALAEFQRRVVVPFEDEAISRNGDIYVPGFNVPVSDAGTTED